MNRSQTVDVGRGRNIAIDETGNPEGFPVYLLHGTPGSRVGPKPRDQVLYRQGVRLISFDRPGYGRSDRREGRSVADVAEDVDAIADALGTPRFAVVGRSGGAPHALACAARLPERVIAAAALVPVAPRNADGLDWLAGMTPDNRNAFTLAAEDPGVLAALLSYRSRQATDDPDSMLPGVDSGLEPSDRNIIGDAGIRRQLLATYRSALEGREQSAGWFDDLRAIADPRGWGFEPARIQVPVLLWHGCADRFAPVSHTEWLADRIPGSVLSLDRAASHFSAVPALPELLARVLDLAEVPVRASLAATAAAAF